MTASAVSASLAQWLFPAEALKNAPAVASGFMSPERELYDRARGVEFLFRLGSSLGLPTTALMTAATWFHRFYMRFSMEDYHRQDVAAACIFLATKTEECGRKLRDVARIVYAKTSGQGADPMKLPSDHPEVERTQNNILYAEEALLEALCFDFIVENPHAELVELLERHAEAALHEYAWSLAHDTFRTPLCILYAPHLIAAACFVLAQHLAEGPHSPGLDARIAATPAAASLPTPPTHKAASPDASRVAVDYYRLSEGDLENVADILCVMLDFYHAQDKSKVHYLGPILSITHPTTGGSRERLFPMSFAQLAAPPPTEATPSQLGSQEDTRTPRSTHGGATPAPPAAAKPPSKGWKPVGGEQKLQPPLDLS